MEEGWGKGGRKKWGMGEGWKTGVRKRGYGSGVRLEKRGEGWEEDRRDVIERSYGRGEKGVVGEVTDGGNERWTKKGGVA